MKSKRRHTKSLQKALTQKNLQLSFTLAMAAG
jgi:hypothetical protein